MTSSMTVLQQFEIADHGQADGTRASRKLRSSPTLSSRDEGSLDETAQEGGAALQQTRNFRAWRRQCA